MYGRGGINLSDFIKWASSSQARDSVFRNPEQRHYDRGLEKLCRGQDDNRSPLSFPEFIPFVVLKQNTSGTQVPEIAFCLSQKLLKFTLSVSDRKTWIWAASESSAKWCILSKTRHHSGNRSQLFKWYHCLGCACKGSVLDIDSADSPATAKRKSNGEIPNGPRHSGVLFQLQLHWHCPRQQDVHVRQLDNTSETKEGEHNKVGRWIGSYMEDERKFSQFKTVIKAAIKCQSFHDKFHRFQMKVPIFPS